MTAGFDHFSVFCIVIALGFAVIYLHCKIRDREE